MFKTLLKEGILISIVTVFGYILTIMYQYGQLNYYYLPIEFINLDVIKIFESILIVATVTFLVFAMLDSISELVDYKSLTFWLIIRLSIWAFFFLILINIPMKGKPFYAFVGVGLMILINEIVLPIFKYRKIKNFEDKLKKAREDDSKKKKSKFLSIISSLFQSYPKLRILLLTIVTTISVTFILGFYDMQTRETFYTLHLDNKDYVVVSIKPENLILIQFDKKNKKLSNNFNIFPIFKIPDEVFIKIEKVGKLKRYGF